MPTRVPRRLLRPLVRSCATISSSPAPPRKVINVVELQRMRKRGERISMVTAYDFPSAVHADQAGVDVVLVGDSVGMVQLGYDTTQPVTMDDILLHAKAVRRGCHRPLLVGDMPFGSYEACLVEAQHNAYRLIKEGGMDCVKLEGGSDKRIKTVEAIVDGGVAVMGHIGLTPQAFSTLGGFRVQGKTASKAAKLLREARALEQAGAFALVIECVPQHVAELVTQSVGIPTIGIGAGKHTNGQVLVYHDMLGMMQHHHHAKVAPKFCKQYANVGVTIQAALEQYSNEVKAHTFPSDEHSPYHMSDEQLQLFKLEAAKILEEEEGQGYMGSPGDKEEVFLTQAEREAQNVPEDEQIKLY